MEPCTRRLIIAILLIFLSSNTCSSVDISTTPQLMPEPKPILLQSIKASLPLVGTPTAYSDAQQLPTANTSSTFTGTTEHISVNTRGELGNITSYDPSRSADGRFVAFESDA